jgi:hypothetical protein
MWNCFCVESTISDIQRRSGPDASRSIMRLQRCGKHVGFLHLIFLM